MAMPDSNTRFRPSGPSRANFGAAEARGPVIDQEGREIPPESLEQGFREFRFDFSTANPFGNLTRELGIAPGDIVNDRAGHRPRRGLIIRAMPWRRSQHD